MNSFRQLMDLIENASIDTSNLVSRIDSNLIKNFSKDMRSYKHTADWTQSGLDTGDSSYWDKQGIKPLTSRGVFAGDPWRSALYSTGNANETHYVEMIFRNGKRMVFFDERDLPRIQNHVSYETFFDRRKFSKTNQKNPGAGEYFSSDPGNPIKQEKITNAIALLRQRGWEVRFVPNLSQWKRKAKNLQQDGELVSWGAEGV